MEGDVVGVAVLLRREGRILLVEQRPAAGLPAAWTLPSGAAAADESLLETVQRVLRAQTGLEAIRLGDAVQVVQVRAGATAPPEAPASLSMRTTTLLFEVPAWRGDVGDAPTDDSIVQARFWPREEALEQLERTPWRSRYEPLAGYLRTGDSMRVWLYRRDETGAEEREWPSPDEPEEAGESVRRARAVVALGCIVLLAVLLVIVIIGLITVARPFV